MKLEGFPEAKAWKAPGQPNLGTASTPKPPCAFRHGLPRPPGQFLQSLINLLANNHVQAQPGLCSGFPSMSSNHRLPALKLETVRKLIGWEGFRLGAPRPGLTEAPWCGNPDPSDHPGTQSIASRSPLPTAKARAVAVPARSVVPALPPGLFVQRRIFFFFSLFFFFFSAFFSHWRIS